MDTDVDMLVPPSVADKDIPECKESAEEISRTFCKIGITQVVLGLVLVGGGIATSAGNIHEDGAGEGIWGGIIVLVCGCLAITSRYHLLLGVVIASLVLNLLASLLLFAGIVLGSISAFHNLVCEYCWAGTAKFLGFTALNCGLIACIILSIYMATIYAKILNEKTNFISDCCQKNPSWNPGGYTMVYVPPGTQQPAASCGVGTFMAVPAAQPIHMHQ